MQPVYDWVDVVDEPYMGPRPRLPQRARGWPPMTRAWWRAVSRMPHCVLWTAGDWQFALETALLVAAYHEGELRLAGEVRQRERVLGLTADARRDLRIRYVPPWEEDAKPMALAEEYRRRLAS